MGIFYAILASIMYGVEPTLVDFALASGLSAIDIQVLSTIITTLMAYIICRSTKTSLHFTLKQFWPLLLCSITFYLTSYFQSVSYLYIPVGLSTTIHFTYPALVLIGCLVFFKENITRFKIYSTLIALAGFLLLAGSLSGINFTGALIAFASAVVYAIYMITSEKSAIGDYPAYGFTFHTNLYGCFYAILSFSFTHESIIGKIPLYIEQLPCLIIISLMLFIAAFSLNKGIKLMGANLASSFTVVEPVSSLIVSTIVFHYQLTFPTLLGCTLILLSVYLATKQ